MEKIVKVNTLPALARATVEEYVTNKNIINVDSSCLTEYQDKQAGVFVTLYKSGELRGCIGTISFTEENIIKEAIKNAISACSKDPRFQPVTSDELALIKYTVSVLMPPEPIDSVDKLDPKKYGVIVTAHGNRRALLLPNLEGIDTVDQQMYYVMRKGQIHHSETITLYRFESIEHKE